MTNGLELLGSAKTVLLTTFKRDGTAVSTPVSIALTASAHTFELGTRRGRQSGLQTTLRSKWRPAPFGASRQGPALPVHARLLQGDDARLAAKVLAEQHPLLQAVLVPLTHRLMRYRTMHYLLSTTMEN
jgi:PPOX class probable F420-dependent enzyme